MPGSARSRPRCTPDAVGTVVHLNVLEYDDAQHRFSAEPA